jgi:hypothetical protein
LSISLSGFQGLEAEVKIAITFDVDMYDYVSVHPFDEIEICFPILQRILIEHPEIKTTWFLRIDSQIMKLFGKSQHIFKKYGNEIEWLLSNGHEIAWHHHAYQIRGKEWLQNFNENEICNELKQYGEQALGLGIVSSRMGWAFHTNETMKTLDTLGFAVDSSAVPRPKYRWDNNKRDWTITPQTPYHPSLDDYRVSGTSNFGIWEVPITTTEIPASTDSQRNVMRYLNPTYRAEIFRKAILKISSISSAVMTCHPYEIVPNATKHSLLSFNSDQFVRNLELLIENSSTFCTICEIV